MHPFAQWLSSQSLDFNSLYQDKFSCLGMLKLFPQEDQVLILQLLFLNDPIAKDVNNSALIDLCIIKKSVKDEKMVLLNPLYQQNLRKILVQPTLLDAINSNTEVYDHANDRLNEILQSLVKSNTSKMKNSIRILMKNAELISKDSITNKGFQFLLQTTSLQYWSLIQVYLKLATTEMHLVLLDVVKFIFLLTLLEPGKGFNSSALTKTQTAILDDFHTLGLCYYDKEAHLFYPTQFTTCLLKEISHTNTDSKFIIIETNFKIYAYTESELQKSILKLFIHMKTEFKNMVAGQLSRDSVRTALNCGISANQIVDYLSTHCHQLMNSDLPMNIKDQLYLWEQERDRLISYNGFLYSDFPSSQLYKSTLEYATRMNVLIWSNINDRLMFIQDTGHDLMKQFITNEQSRLTN
eukprot:NODE_1037_length_2504_cov_0.688565.p1 type:complete len:409 gc:universal NODE_1037_length_2504_cov_0.688565:1125-2351(+)